MNKFLSVIIPSYNMEKYLPKCIGSLMLGDTELQRGLEVIVVNDGSKDRTSAIAHEWEQKYPCVVRVIDKKNGHYGSCINVGVGIAKGTYVKVVDADDYVDTDAMMKLCLVLAKEDRKGNNGADLIVSSYKNVDPNGRVLEVFDYGLDDSHGYYTLDEYPEERIRFTVHSVVYRTAMIREMGYRQSEGINYTDSEWIIEPMARVRRFLFFKTPVSCYLVGREGQSTEHEIFAKNFQQFADVTVKLVERYQEIYTTSEKTSVRYCYNRIQQIVSYVYSGWLVGRGEYSCKVDIGAFEKRIKGKGDFYDKAGLLSARIKFYRYDYVRDWRKWHFVYTPRRILFAVLLKVAKICYRFKRIRQS